MSVKKVWMNKDSKIITLFFFFELFILVAIFILTFVTDVRKFTLGRNVSSRQEAIKKGYGYYSDPEIGDCFTETGNCETPGTRFLYQRCVPNFSDGNKYGVGCVDNDGLFTYNMIITEDGCNQQCFEDTISLQDNIQTSNSNGTLVITSIGTHQLLDKETGLDMSDYFIGDFQVSSMTYDLKNCINNIKQYAGYKQKQYTCQPGTQGGVDGCLYSCGTDPTITFNESVSQNTQQFLGSIPFPYYISGGTINDDGTITGGTKVFICKDIQDNNAVEMFNHGQTIPADFIFPDKCYNHINLTQPPDDNAGTLITAGTNIYNANDRYIYIDQNISSFAPYFQSDYNYLNDLRTYVKIISNQEIMLLSRMYDGIGGLQATQAEDSVVGYVAVPDDVVTQQEVESSTSISFTGGSIIPDVTIISRFGTDTSIVHQGGFYFVPFLMLGVANSKALFSNIVELTGSYVYDEPNDSLTIYLPGAPLNDSSYVFLRFSDVDYWIPRIFEVQTVNGFGTISYNTIPYSKPNQPSGDIVFKNLNFSDYTVKLNNAQNNFVTDLSDIIVTGSMTVDDFDLDDANDQIQPLKFASPTEDTFYVKGTPNGSSPTALLGKLGFYYPLSLTEIDPDKTYQQYTFQEYPEINFYLPTIGGTTGSIIMSGSFSGYDFVTGVGTVLLPTISTKLTYQNTVFDTVTWTSPSVKMRGRGYITEPYQVGTTKSFVSVSEIDNDDNTLLEVVRNGDPLFLGFETNLIVDGQLRKTVEQDIISNGSYEITVFPEKILQVERDFGNFLGPYTADQNGKRSFVCVDSTGTPVQDGTVIRFNIGETVTALIQDYNFNTNVPSECGSILLENQNSCRQERDSSIYNVSQSCVGSNPDGNYWAVEDFLEDGYLLGDDNKLECFVSGSSVDDSRCTQPYLTDYLVTDRTYAPGEELIVNNGDIKSYVSLKDNNLDLPSSDNWATYSGLQEISFNVGQYLGTQQTYITTTPGSIFMDMDYNIRPLEILKYRTEDDYTATEAIFSGLGLDYDQFRNQSNLVTPYLLAASAVNNEIGYQMLNTDVSNPSIRILLTTPVAQSQDNIFLQENYLNRLLWYMSSFNFLDKTTTELAAFANINFVKLTEGSNTVVNMNTSTTLTLHNSQTKVDLTGYYCYFMPMFGSDNFLSPVTFNALFPYQWGAYIYGLLDSEPTNLPCKFEVVYVQGYQDSMSQISMIRNVTGIPDEQKFNFISIQANPGKIDGVYGLLLPFSKQGPFHRLNQLNSDKASFDLQFSLPTNYSILTEHLEAGILPVDGLANTYSYFNYGYSGFTIEDGYQSPSFDAGNVKLVQYNITGSRESSEVYIKHIRVTDNDKIYFTEVGNGNLVYQSGDVISFLGFQFNVLGQGVNLLSANKEDYELFDYQVEPVSGDFVQNYNNDVYFGGYVKYFGTGNSYIDFLLPSIYRNPANGNLNFVLNISYKSQSSVITIIPSDISTPSSPEAVIVTTDINEITFLQDPTGTPLANNVNAGQFIRMVNSGENMILTTISIINIEGQSSISVSEIVGKPYGRLSYPDGFVNNYATAILGKSFISKFQSTNTSLGNETRYEVDGYNFGVENVDLASVNMVLKTYTSIIDYYRNIQSRTIYGDLILFTDFRSKLTYRNNTSAPTSFDITKIDSQIWADNGKVNPQVTYKLYHEFEIYSEGDIVKYNNLLWKAEKDISLAPPGGTSRQTPNPLNSDWSQQTPQGELYSGFNYFDTLVTPLADTSNNELVQLDVTSNGDVHIFPSPKKVYDNPFTNATSNVGEVKYLFNTRYKFNMTGTPTLYLSSGGQLMDGKYNFTQNQYIMEINYFLDNIEVSRSRYLTNNGSASRVDISILIRRAEKSLLTFTLISQSNTIQFGSDVTAGDGELLFVNIGEDVVGEVQILNQINDQDIPIRLSSGVGNDLGYCFEGCSKNISDSYTDSDFDFINLITSGLKTSFFNNILRSYQSSGSFVTLSNEPCDILYTSGDRYLTNCTDVDGSGTIYSQYLFSVPNLTRDQYGVPFCGTTGPSTLDSLSYSNSVFFYFAPMDIDSQNFLKLTPKTGDVFNFNTYFKPNGTSNPGSFTLTTDQIIINETDGSYSQPSNSVTIAITSNQTTIVNGFFTGKDILTIGPFDIINGSNTILFTPIAYDISFSFTASAGTYAVIDKYTYWWLVDQNDVPISYGFFFWPGATKPASITTSKMVRLSFVQDLELYGTQSDLKIMVKGGDLANDVTTINGYTIQDYNLQASGTISTTSQLVTYSGKGVNVSVYFDASSNIYQPGDYAYTSSSTFSTTDTLYWKLFGDQCICKTYLNYGKYNAQMSFQTDGTTVPTDGGVDTIPLIFNRTKKSILSLEEDDISIVEGDNLVDTSQFASTFIIEGGVLKPNPIQKPFNLSQTSTFYPNVLDLDLSVVSSGSSSNLVGTKLSVFSITDMGDAIDYLTGINGEIQNSYVTNSELIDLSYRQNLIRDNYEDAEYECNFILPPNNLIPTQASYELEQNGNNLTVIKSTGASSVSVRTNNYTTLDQSAIGAPLKLSVDGTEITSQNVSYPNNQYLIVQYILGVYTVDMDTYMDQTNFSAASVRLINFVYQTEYEGTTTPGVTEITVEGGFTINIIENS
jgi:hypothetical protein